MSWNKIMMRVFQPSDEINKNMPNTTSIGIMTWGTKNPQHPLVWNIKELYIGNIHCLSRKLQSMVELIGNNWQKIVNFINFPLGGSNFSLALNVPKIEQ